MTTVFVPREVQDGETRVAAIPETVKKMVKLGLTVTPSVANFLLIHFKDAATAVAADEFLTRRGLILRRVAGYKLPAALRMTVGGEEANRLAVQVLGEFVESRK